VAAALASAGVGVAAARYPGGFDWQYQVMSVLASSVHNPEGGAWFATGLALSILALWPVTTRLREVMPRGAGTRAGVGALRAGIALGVMTGLERLPPLDASGIFQYSHELLAFASFLSLYFGIVAICVVQLRSGHGRQPLPIAMLAYFTVLGALMLYLWLGQRELGWVGRHWRTLGLEPWRSFAFWQWLACASVWMAFAGFAWGWRPSQSASR
jgi:hypothetical protein